MRPDFMYEVPIVKHNVSAAAALTTARNTRNSRRDPRAAPRSIHYNISIVETCRFYDVADSVTSCRVPRSCYDCLQLPHCLLAFDGRCHDVSDDIVKGFRDASVQVPTTVKTQPLVTNDLFSFFSGSNTTYCSASDPICADCRTKFESLALLPKSSDTLMKQYCLGPGKCVCLGMCEVPAMRAAQTYDRDCAAPTPVYVNPGRVKASSASSVHRDPRAPPQRLVHRRKPDTCEYYSDQDVQGCRVPRSCQDCLETEGCMILDHKCVSMESYDIALDFRNRTRPAHSSCTPLLQFPSTNTTYCPLSDETCATCRVEFAKTAQTWSYGGPSRTCYNTNTTYCVGTGGCVCIEQCEDPGLQHQEQRFETCRVGQLDITSKPAAIVSTVVIVVLVVLVSAIWGLVRMGRTESVRQTVRQAAVTVMRHMLDHAPALNLDLFGWRQFHDRLLEKEQELLSGVENVSPVSRPPVDFEFTDASAPDFEDDDSSAPTATDPHALASAPVVHWGVDHQETHDPTIPTAPDMTDL